LPIQNNNNNNNWTWEAQQLTNTYNNRQNLLSLSSLQIERNFVEWFALCTQLSTLDWSTPLSLTQGCAHTQISHKNLKHTKIQNAKKVKNAQGTLLITCFEIWSTYLLTYLPTYFKIYQRPSTPYFKYFRDNSSM
jgi:hypothetical protein